MRVMSIAGGSSFIGPPIRSCTLFPSVSVLHVDVVDDDEVFNGSLAVVVAVVAG